MESCATKENEMTKRIAVIGMGYVGLPMSVSFAGSAGGGIWVRHKSTKD